MTTKDLIGKEVRHKALGTGQIKAVSLDTPEQFITIDFFEGIGIRNIPVTNFVCGTMFVHSNRFRRKLQQIFFQTRDEKWHAYEDFPDRELTCIDCGRKFVYRTEEQVSYFHQDLAAPTVCEHCILREYQRYSGTRGTSLLMQSSISSRVKSKKRRLHDTDGMSVE